jgi:hypothetical protein
MRLFCERRAAKGGIFASHWFLLGGEMSPAYVFFGELIEGTI